MAFKPIITVGRQYGSGGREVALKLAERLNVPFYDKELLNEAAKDSGISRDVMESYDEKQEKRSFLSMIGGVQGRGDLGTADMPLNHRIFLAQFDAIRRIASEGPCVIVGRCSDYVLRDYVNAVNVFIKAPMEDRINRITRLHGLDPLKAEESIRKADKQRAAYYNYFDTGTWGSVDNYHLCVDTGALGVDGAVDLIADCVELRARKLGEDKIEW